jgi:hypothetical protein
MTAFLPGAVAMPSRARFGIALLGLSAVLLAVPETGRCQADKQPAVTSNDEDGPSFDDIKDVCEAIQFVAITVGIAAALYWFWKFWLPYAQSHRVEFDVDVRCVDGRDGSRLIEVAAEINNVGCVPAEITRCWFTLSAVNPDAAATKAGPLAESNALTPLFESEWTPTKTSIDAESRTQFTCPAAIPRSVTHVVVTGQLMQQGRPKTQSASRLVAMTDQSTE